MSFEQKYYEAPEFWAEGVLTNEGNLLRIRETIAVIPEDVRSLLDVGCGNGVFPNTLSQMRRDIQVTATDRSNEALKYVRTEKFQSDITKLQRPDRQYDCVTCLQVIEHIPYQQYQPALDELARVSNRYIVVGIPFEEDLLRDFTECPSCMAQFNLNFHFRSYTSETLKSLFARSGFKLKLEKNIAKERRFHGHKLYAKARAWLSPTKPKVFYSPICPVCGFENADFQLPPSGDSAVPTFRSQGVKGLIKKFWPSYEVNGYWSIALYERY